MFQPEESLILNDRVGGENIDEESVLRSGIRPEDGNGIEQGHQGSDVIEQFLPIVREYRHLCRFFVVESVHRLSVFYYLETIGQSRGNYVLTIT